MLVLPICLKEVCVCEVCANEAQRRVKLHKILLFTPRHSLYETETERERTSNRVSVTCELSRDIIQEHFCSKLFAGRKCSRYL